MICCFLNIVIFQITLEKGNIVSVQAIFIAKFVSCPRNSLLSFGERLHSDREEGVPFPSHIPFIFFCLLPASIGQIDEKLLYNSIRKCKAPKRGTGQKCYTMVPIL